MDTITRFSPLEIPTIVKAHYRTSPKVPVNFIAEPSTVKSEGCLQVSKELAQEENREFFEWNRKSLEEKEQVLKEPEKYFVFADLRASETDIGELRLQDMRNGEDYITFKYNVLFRAVSHENAKGILFFDEMNLAPNMIKAQFYKILNDGAVGDIPISRGVLCISAGNEAEHSRGITEDPVPLVLRRGNYFLRPLTQEEYTDYAVKTGHHQWVLGYLGFQPNDVHNIAYDLPEGVGQPCPRTWTRLSALLKGNKNLTLEQIRMFATGLVGQGVATKFSAYVKSAKEIRIEDILAKPERINEFDNEDNLSLMYAIISGVVEKVREDKKYLTPAFKIATHMNRPEFGAYLLRQAKQVNSKQFSKSIQEEDKQVVDALVERYAKYIIE